MTTSHRTPSPRSRRLLLIPTTGLLALGLAACASPARADQLIQVPTADRVPGPTVEYLQKMNNGANRGYGTVLAPVGSAYELMFRYYNGIQGGKQRVEGGGQFQILPDGVITPGVAVGLWDVANDSPKGRRAFFVLTKSLRPGPFPLPKPLKRVQVNLGTGTGKFSGILAAARADLPAHLSLVAEFDARKFNAGLWFSPMRHLALKAELQNGTPYVGGQFQIRF